MQSRQFPDLKVTHSVASLAARTGGPARSVPGLCNGLVGVGATVGICTTDHDLNSLNLHDFRFQIAFAESLFSFKPWLFGCLQFSRALETLIKKQRSDILHDHGLWLPVNGASVRIAKKLRLPLVISTRGMLEDWAVNYKSRRKTIAWKLYQNQWLKMASMFHATSAQEAMSIRKANFTQPIAIIPNGVNLPPGNDVEAPDYPHKEVRTLLFISRIHPKKGLLNFVKAFAKIPNHGWEILIVGPDELDHRAEVEKAAARLGISEKVRIDEPVTDSEKWQVYRDADVFVLPTFSENFGIVVAEALASELPVITTTGTPWSELNSHRCGWWIEPTEDALAQTLQKAMALHPNERKAMGKRGRKLVETSYSWNGIAHRMAAAYEFVLGTNNKVPSFIDV